MDAPLPTSPRSAAIATLTEMRPDHRGHPNDPEAAEGFQAMLTQDGSSPPEVLGPAMGTIGGTRSHRIAVPEHVLKPARSTDSLDRADALGRRDRDTLPFAPPNTLNASPAGDGDVFGSQGPTQTPQTPGAEAPTNGTLNDSAVALPRVDGHPSAPHAQARAAEAAAKMDKAQSDIAPPKARAVGLLGADAAGPSPLLPVTAITVPLSSGHANPPAPPEGVPLVGETRSLNHMLDTPSVVNSKAALKSSSLPDEMDAKAPADLDGSKRTDRAAPVSPAERKSFQALASPHAANADLEARTTRNTSLAAPRPTPEPRADASSSVGLGHKTPTRDPVSEKRAVMIAKAPQPAEIAKADSDHSATQSSGTRPEGSQGAQTRGVIAVEGHGNPTRSNMRAPSPVQASDREDEAPAKIAARTTIALPRRSVGPEGPAPTLSHIADPDHNPGQQPERSVLKPPDGRPPARPTPSPVALSSPGALVSNSTPRAEPDHRRSKSEAAPQDVTLPERIGPTTATSQLLSTVATEQPASVRADPRATEQSTLAANPKHGHDPLSVTASLQTTPAGPTNGLATGGMNNPAFTGSAAPMPQHIAQHIVTSLPKPISELGSGTLEIALDPPELGRVRMSLVEVAGTMTLSIQADRPETADLMRRHMDLLTQEFSRSGIDAPNVRVGAEGQGHGASSDQGANAGPKHDATPPGSPLETATTPEQAARPVNDGRALDLRL